MSTSYQLDTMSAKDISLLLSNAGFSDEVCEAFEGTHTVSEFICPLLSVWVWLHVYGSCVDQDMDGEAVTAALASNPGPDCLKGVLPKLGPRLKVYKAFEDYMKV